MISEPVGCLIAAFVFALGCFAIYAMVDVLARWAALPFTRWSMCWRDGRCAGAVGSVMRDRIEADDIVQGAYNRALLDLIIEPMRRVAKEFGYAITVHGSLNRDIDIVAIPWREHNVADPDVLVVRLCGAVGGITGRCNFRSNPGKEFRPESLIKWAEKPHGRIATTLMVWCGENTADLDLSVLPAIVDSDA